MGECMLELAGAPDNKTISIDATYLKALRTASSMGVKKGLRCLISRTKGGQLAFDNGLYFGAGNKNAPFI
jgi:hypothetical protein